MTKKKTAFQPEKQGLYDPAYEHDACGIGFTANIKGIASHQIVSDALTMLESMDHRGAVGAESNTGDGAGILLALPHKFLARVAKEDLKKDLPTPGNYAAGIVFLPEDRDRQSYCKITLEKIIQERGQKIIGWRELPFSLEEADIGDTSRNACPVMQQLFVEANGVSDDDFERELYIIRKKATHEIKRILQGQHTFYVCSLSSKVIVYKGMLTSEQVSLFYKDLQEEDFASHVAMIHSRFSTNTFPSWDRAQPGRFLSHNGEINTLRGNVNWMTARQGIMKSELFKDEDLKSLFPVIEPDCSDSGSFDNALELLLMSGRPLPEAIMMMIPHAWQNNPDLPESVRDFYEYYSCLQEPWDGPASIVITDGNYVGAVLDRNGLRPSRYYLTTDDRIIMGSEVGVLPVDPALVKAKGRLHPGRVFLIDFKAGKLIPDQEVKETISQTRPYGKWLKENRIELLKLVPLKRPPAFRTDTLLTRMKAFGYTVETLHFMLAPLVLEKRDPLGSMGNDSCLACLSDKARLTYDYFCQLFAQVTNPPIDSIREEIVMSLECYLGPERSLLETTPAHCNRLLIRHPIIRNEKLAALKHLDLKGWRTKTIDVTYEKNPKENLPESPDITTQAGKALTGALDRICKEAESAIDEGYSLIILSDRKTGPERVPLSTLLACGAVHHHLVNTEKRTRISIVLETGEAREVHHLCLLFGYGADAINPYLAYEALWKARWDGMLGDKLSDEDDVVNAYRAGVAKGILKVMAKMGISTLASYKGAQIFEALGLDDTVVTRCFAGTANRLKGVNFDMLAEEALRRHELAWPKRPIVEVETLPNNGDFHWRAEGEKHAWNPHSVSSLQVAARNNSKEAYATFAAEIDDESKKRCTLRGLLQFKKGANGSSVPLEEVEPAAEIVKRFCTGAMSFGSISPEAHETLAIAMNRMGAKSNTGEGGEDPARFNPMPNGDSKRSAIKQVASGRFGVTASYLANADEIQIKMAQGAKPGEGGELPGKKVDDRIARIRYSTPGVGLISPPPHHDIYSIEDLKQLIHDLKCANPEARISVKLVSEVGVGTIAAGVAKGYADHILISGNGGGTGASPLTSIKHAGLPWELGIAETHQTLVLNDLRSRVVLQTDGGLKTGRDIVIAALLGAEEFGFATAPLITLGCVMMRKCHKNTCPVGIATQNPVLRKKFAGKPEHIINYFFLLAEQARSIMADLGFRTMDEMIGRVDALKTEEAIKHWKADGLDLSPLLVPASELNSAAGVRCTMSQDHGLEKSLDNKLIKLAENTIQKGEASSHEVKVENTDLTVGAILSNRIVSKWGENGLPENSLIFNFSGSAGQSFGAFLAEGVSFKLTGDANDYVGKGLSGGRIIVRPPEESSFAAEDNMIIGNVALYGATRGQAFFRGMAAERFAIRNSGVQAVVEGVGDHGCEYMTGGRIVILGKTGRNFAAGMSGGIAYILDSDKKFKKECNLNTVELEELEDESEIYELHSLVELHHKHTGSTVAENLLADWNQQVCSFTKVMPTDYKRVLMERSTHSEEIETIFHGESVDG